MTRRVVSEDGVRDVLLAGDGFDGLRFSFSTSVLADETTRFCLLDVACSVSEAGADTAASTSTSNTPSVVALLRFGSNDDVLLFLRLATLASCSIDSTLRLVAVVAMSPSDLRRGLAA